MIFDDLTGALLTFPTTGIAIPYSDQGTTLFVLPPTVGFANTATLGDPTLMQPGDAVGVSYWDDATNQFITLNTTVTNVDGGMARLDDPGAVINPGDSGGGVYNFDGELIGNVWSIVTYADGSLGIDVALLPAGIETLIQ
jgi:S1-C subfamily serine protease